MTSFHEKNNELLHAVSSRDLELTSELIKSFGLDLLNSQDILGTSALHLAVKYGHCSIVNYLVSQQSIDTNLNAYYTYKTDNSYTPLDFAIIYKQPLEVVNLLLTSGAGTGQPLNLLSILLTGDVFEKENDIDYKNLETKTPIIEALIQAIPTAAYYAEIPFIIVLKEELYSLKDVESKQLLQKLIDVFEKQDINHYAEQYVVAKEFTHAFPSGNEYKTINDFTSDLFSAEGMFASSSLTSFYNAFKDYMNLNVSNYSQLQNDVYFEINNSYALAEQGVYNAGLYEQSINLFQSYEQGQTILLHTGWEAHGVDIILDKSLNLYLVANAGERYDSFGPGLRAYNNHAPIGPDDIYQILNNESQYHLEYDLFYDLRLADNTDFSKEFPNQEYGNCALNSLLLANWGLTYINLYKQTSDFQQAKSLSDVWHNDLVEHHKTFVLKNYLEKPYFIDDIALYDVLTKYESNIDHVEKQEQTHLLLDYLTLPEHVDNFKDFYKNNPESFSTELTLFIKANNYGDILEVKDVLNFDKASTPGINVSENSNSLIIHYIDDLIRQWLDVGTPIQHFI